MYRSCDGCPQERAKRPAGWQAAEISQEAMRISSLIDEGFTVGLHDTPVLLVEAALQFRQTRRELNLAEAEAAARERERQRDNDSRKAVGDEW